MVRSPMPTGVASKRIADTRLRGAIDGPVLQSDHPFTVACAVLPLCQGAGWIEGVEDGVGEPSFEAAGGFAFAPDVVVVNTRHAVV
jgi:hypothetical protein